MGGKYKTPESLAGSDVPICELIYEQNEDCFWAQFASSDPDRINNLIHQAFGQLSPVGSIGDLSDGDAVICQFSEDGVWYRGIVKNCKVRKPKGVLVNFIDFGNEEVVKQGDVSKFMVLPNDELTSVLMSAIPMEDILFEAGDILDGDTMSKLLTDLNEAGANFIFVPKEDIPNEPWNGQDIREGTLSVEMNGVRRTLLAVYEKGMDCFDEIADINGGEPEAVIDDRQEESGISEEFDRFSVSKDILKNKQKMQVYFSCFVDGLLWLESADEEDKNTLHAAVQESAQNSPPLRDVQVGSPCLCLYSEDQNWYRGLVTEMDGDTVLVKFIDYGNDEKTTKDRLLVMNSDLRVEEMKAWPMEFSDEYDHQLAGFIQTGQNDYEMFFTMTEYRLHDLPFEYTLGDITVRHISDQNSSEQNLVDLFSVVTNDVQEQVEDQPNDQPLPTEPVQPADHEEPVGQECNDLHDQLFNQKLQAIQFTASKDMDCGIVAWEDECDIYMFSNDNWTTLNHITETLQEIFKGPPDARPAKIDHPEVGQSCLAVFDDGSLYRAEIVEKPSEDLVTAVFIDFGNQRDISLKNEQRPFYKIPAELMTIPKLAFPVRINGQDDFSESQIAKIREWVDMGDAQPGMTIDIIDLVPNSDDTDLVYHVDLKVDGLPIVPENDNIENEAIEEENVLAEYVPQEESAVAINCQNKERIRADSEEHYIFVLKQNFSRKTGKIRMSGHLLDDEDRLIAISDKLYESMEGTDTKPISSHDYQIDMSVIVKANLFDDASDFFRARIVKTNPLKVYLVDYGYSINADEVFPTQPQHAMASTEWDYLGIEVEIVGEWSEAIANQFFEKISQGFNPDQASICPIKISKKIGTQIYIVEATNEAAYIFDVADTSTSFNESTIISPPSLESTKNGQGDALVSNGNGLDVTQSQKKFWCNDTSAGRYDFDGTYSSSKNHEVVILKVSKRALPCQSIPEVWKVHNGANMIKLAVCNLASNYDEMASIIDKAMVTTKCSANDIKVGQHVVVVDKPYDQNPSDSGYRRAIVDEYSNERYICKCLDTQKKISVTANRIFESPSVIQDLTSSFIHVYMKKDTKIVEGDRVIISLDRKFANRSYEGSIATDHMKETLCQRIRRLEEQITKINIEPTVLEHISKSLRIVL